jgi:3'-phosphoadenosine 5'-phosphosulfate sulfotransferase (PAPS reductase)/FAD synthetase
MNKVVHVISVSSGKDSQATLDLAVKRCPPGSVIPIFCDTDNEDAAVYEHLDYLERLYGIPIRRLKADFTDELIAKRQYIARDTRHRREYRRVSKTDRGGNPIYVKDREGRVRLFPVYAKDADGNETREVIEYAPRQAVGWDSGRKVRWSNKAKRRALSVMYPSGNAFLDLCMWKGRFPSRKAQFCTEELKRNIAVEFQLELIDQGYRVISWQGVRRDESHNRRKAKLMERIGPKLWAFRPIVEWTAMQVIRLAVDQGHRLNRLYSEGCTRVGCMPCINCNKNELRETSQRRPHHLERVSDWERIVGMCSKRGFSTFMADSHPSQDRRVVFNDLRIESRIEWAMTTRGGKQLDLLAQLDEPTACSSSYGLCE